MPTLAIYPSMVVVCLYVVCRIRALCLKRSRDLDATWQVQDLILSEGITDTKENGRFWVEPPTKICKLTTKNDL